MKSREVVEPKVRFPSFEDSWERQAVAKILNRERTPVDVEPDTQYVQIGIRSHGKGIFYKNPVSGKSLGNKRVFWVQAECLILNIVFAWEHAVSRTTQMEIGYIASHRFPMYSPKNDKADIGFIVKLFLRPRGKHLLGLASPGGAGRNRTLGQKEFEKLKIYTPARPEQQRIDEFLTTVDVRIEQLVRRKALLSDYKRGVMQQLFRKSIRFRDGGNEYPDWTEELLGELGDFKNGLNKDKADFGFGSPFINLMDVFGKRFLNQEKFGLVNANEKELSSYNLRAGDVLFIRSSVKRTGVGEAIVVAEDLPNTVYSGFLIRFRPKNSVLTHKFMMYTFAVESFRKELLSYATTSANTNINQESLAKIQVRIPSVDEQVKIAELLSSIDQEIEIIGLQIEETRTFKKGLLQKMFV